MVPKIVKKESSATKRVEDTNYRDYCAGGCYATVRLSESSANKRNKVPELIEKQNKDAKGKDTKKRLTDGVVDLSDQNDENWASDMTHIY